MLSTDPIDLLLDHDGDLDITNGRASFTSGLVGVSQGIQISLQNVEGEWFADLDEGIPLFERETVPATRAILGGKFSAQKTRDIYRTALVARPGVKDITSLIVEFSRATRQLDVSWRVTTVFGDLAGGIVI